MSCRAERTRQTILWIDGMNAALSQQGFVRGQMRLWRDVGWVPPEPNGIYVPKWKCHCHLGTEGPS
jgi:hypothetical protein